MEATHLLVRPAPRYEHPGQWFTAPEPDPTPAFHAVAPARAGVEPGPPQPVTPPREIRAVVVGVMTQMFEVIDRRRPSAQLVGMVAPHVIDQINALCATPRGAGASVRRVHLQVCAPDAAEFFGSYVRGQRVLAFAGRIERVRVKRRRPTNMPRYSGSPTELRWQVRSVAFG